MLPRRTDSRRADHAIHVPLRRIIVTAIASDDWLMENLVLKGGNALELAFGIGNRASVDIDYSIGGEFSNSTEVSSRLFGALKDRFDAHGLVLFDESFGPRPASAGIGAKWGGYRAEFKLASRELYNKHKAEIDRVRREAVASDPSQRRIFKIDISRYEYVGSSQYVDIDDYSVKVYTPLAIAVEKLRALCQQMKEYTGCGSHPEQRRGDPERGVSERAA